MFHAPPISRNIASLTMKDPLRQSVSGFLSLCVFLPEVPFLRPVARKSGPRECPLFSKVRRMAGIWAKFLCCIDQQCCFKRYSARPLFRGRTGSIAHRSRRHETLRERCRDSIMWIDFTTTYKNARTAKVPLSRTRHRDLWVGLWVVKSVPQIPARPG
jgi:hypothetical protein